MRKAPAAALCLMTFASVFSALPAKAVPSALPTPAQAECAAVNPAKGEDKFTGQISKGPTDSSIEVTAGSQTVVVIYNNSVTVCQGGQPASVNILARGANVVVYGPMKRNGKNQEMTAAKILVAGAPQAGMRGSDAMITSGAAKARSGTEPASNNTTSAGAQTKSGSDSMQTGSVTGATGRGQNSGPISCSALTFGVSIASGVGSGAAAGKTSVSGITCKRSVDQLALQLSQDALNRRLIPSVTLNWQNQLEASLNDATITSVQFTSDNGTQVVEITFSYRKAEIVHVPSGARITF